MYQTSFLLVVSASSTYNVQDLHLVMLLHAIGIADMFNAAAKILEICEFIRSLAAVSALTLLT